MNDMTEAFRKLKRRMQVVAAETVSQAAQDALQAATLTVPVKTGQLRASGDWRLVRFTQSGAEGTLFYGASYAPNIHENANSNGYKWMENAANSIDLQAIFDKKWEESE